MAYNGEGGGRGMAISPVNGIFHFLMDYVRIDNRNRE